MTTVDILPYTFQDHNKTQCESCNRNIIYAYVNNRQPFQCFDLELQLRYFQHNFAEKQADILWFASGVLNTCII